MFAQLKNDLVLCGKNLNYFTQIIFLNGFSYIIFCTNSMHLGCHLFLIMAFKLFITNTDKKIFYKVGIHFIYNIFTPYELQ